jgi:hypothetical protein
MNKGFYSVSKSKKYEAPTSASYAVTASYIDPNFISASAAASGFGSGGGTFDSSSFVTNSQTGSFVLNSQTSSFVTNLQTGSFIRSNQTGSFATTGSNSFIGTQRITGSLIISGSGTMLDVTGTIYLRSLADPTSLDNFTTVVTAGPGGKLFTNSLTNYLLNSVTSSMLSAYVENSYTSSVNTSINNLNTATASLNNSVSNLNTFTASVVTGYVANTQTSSFVLNTQTGSFLTTGSTNATQTVLGSLVINQNLTVLGSSSIQTISSSTLNIGTNLITVNTINPATRFGGLAVIDSGSSPQVSGSLLFDSQENQWIFIHQNQGVITSSMLIMGPETYDSVGNEIHLTQNRLMKSVNDEHIGDSNITDTGTIVSINSNTQITGSLIVSGSSALTVLGASTFRVSGSNVNAIQVQSSDWIAGSKGVALSINAPSGTTSATLQVRTNGGMGAGDLALGSGTILVGTVSGSLIGSASYATTASYVAGYVTNSQTGSFATTSSYVANTQTASIDSHITNVNAYTASVSSSIYNINLTTASFGTTVNGISNKTGSFAVTGSNIFIGNQIISGSVNSSGSFSLSGSLSTSGSISNVGQSVLFTPRMIATSPSQSFFNITGSLQNTGSTIGSQVYGVNINPLMIYATGSQTQTAFRVAPQFSGSSAFTSSQSNIVADFGAVGVGTQFSVNDITSGSIYLVNDISGLPIIEALSDWTVNMYNYPTRVFQKTGSAIIISASMNISGSLTMAPSSSFILPLTASSVPAIGSAYWSGSFLFVYNGTRYMSASFF